MRRPKISPEELGRLIANFDCDPNLTSAGEHCRLIVRDRIEPSHAFAPETNSMFLESGWDVISFTSRQIVIPPELVNLKKAIAFTVYLES